MTAGMPWHAMAGGASVSYKGSPLPPALCSHEAAPALPGVLLPPPACPGTLPTTPPAGHSWEEFGKWLSCSTVKF